MDWKPVEQIRSQLPCPREGVKREKTHSDKRIRQTSKTYYRKIGEPAIRDPYILSRSSGLVETGSGDNKGLSAPVRSEWTASSISGPGSTLTWRQSSPWTWSALPRISDLIPQKATSLCVPWVRCRPKPTEGVGPPSLLRVQRTRVRTKDGRWVLSYRPTDTTECGH